MAKDNKVQRKMKGPQTKVFQEEFLDDLRKRMEDMKKDLKQVSQILEKKTFLQGGWPEEYWLYIKKHLQTEIESLKKLIERLEKNQR